MIDWLERALSGEIVVSIGQLSKDDTRVLDRAVKRGEIVKWRGHWFPIDGHPTYGMGQLKTCYSVSKPDYSPVTEAWS